MGGWSILRANLGSIRTQRELEAALEAGDSTTVERLISESIVKILKAGLSHHERRNLDQLKETHRNEIEALITDAFDRGWLRDGRPNLSNAMDEVLITVARRIKQGRLTRECD